MNASRFFGATNREAMRQVRLALGPDAMIISSRRVNGGVEVLAADHEYAAGKAIAPGPAGQAGGGDLLGAIGALRGSLEDRMEDLLWGSRLRENAGAAILFQRLLASGFSTALLRALLARLPANLADSGALEWARRELTGHLPVADEEIFRTPGAVVALVGPTGAGKTTTLAKIAARHAGQSGGGLALVTTDGYRIGAHEQLMIYGRKLGMPVHLAHTAADLRSILAGIAPRCTVLVDTMGISQRDGRLAGEAEALAAAGRPVHRLLVMNAASHGDTLDEAARAWASDAGAPLAGCIVTKTDEAVRLAGALDTAIRHRLPLHYVSTGQRVPEDLVLPGASSLIAQALDGDCQSRALYAPTPADFAALLTLNEAPQALHTAQRMRHDRERRLAPVLLLAARGSRPESAAAIEAGCRWLEEDAVAAAAWHAWLGRPHVITSDEDHASTFPDSAVQFVTHGRLRLPHAAASACRTGIRVAFDQHATPGWNISRLSAEPGMPCMGISVASDAHAMSGTGITWTFSEHDMPAGLSADGLQWRGSWHVIDAPGQAPIRKAHALFGRWLALVPPSARLLHDGCVTTAQAVARTLSWSPVEGISRLGLAGPAWLASAGVTLSVRSRPDLAVMLLCLRMDSTMQYALASCASPEVCTPASGAAAILAGMRSRQVCRYVSQAWTFADGRQRADDLLATGELAALLGIASWRLQYGPASKHARESLRALPGGDVAGVHGLMRLLALKEMLDP